MPLLEIKSNSELEAEDLARKEAFEPADLDYEELPELVAYLESTFDAARQAKRPIERRMLKGLRARRSEYESEILAKIKEQGGCDIYMALTDQKCNAIEAQLKNIMFPAGERNWKIDETPVPELPPSTLELIQQKVQSEALQFMLLTGQTEVLTEDLANRFKEWEGQITEELNVEAKKKSKLITIKVDDNLLKGGWYGALNDIIYDVASFPSCILRGPVYQYEKVLGWGRDEIGGFNPVVEKDIIGRYYRVNPFDFYPEPGIRNVNDGYCWEVHPLERSELSNYIGVEGFDEEAIRKVLNDYSESGHRENSSLETERLHAEDGIEGTREDPENTIDAKEFNGKIKGSKLISYGFTDNIEDPDMDYDVNVWMVSKDIIKIQFNAHPLGKKDYYMTSFRDRNDSVWGTSPAEIMYDKQRACNAAGRNLIDNMGMASGPQVEVNVSRLPQNEKSISKLYPWKIWQTTDDIQGKGGAGIHFYQPNMHTNELMQIYQFFSGEASEVLGVPSYTYGGPGDAGGAGETASGLSMLMNAASIGIKMIIKNIDINIILESLNTAWLHVMLYDPDQDIKGDVEFLARASNYLVQKEELRVRANEFLNSTMNETDMAIVGHKGRAAVLREVVKGLKLEGNIIPTEEEVERDELVQQIQAQLLEAQQVNEGGANFAGTPPALQSGANLDAAGNPVSGTDARTFGQNGNI